MYHYVQWPNFTRSFFTPKCTKKKIGDLLMIWRLLRSCYGNANLLLIGIGMKFEFKKTFSGRETIKQTAFLMHSNFLLAFKTFSKTVMLTGEMRIRVIKQRKKLSALLLLKTHT